ncbi:MAG TPA: hypothetical protein EYQ50_08205 [Verrucomicrobiales bacterium]|nr:hypothetical protein [Verrucomicrobiales bacterium]
MGTAIKLILLIFLLWGSLFFGSRFAGDYHNMVEEESQEQTTDSENPPLPDFSQETKASETVNRLGVYGATFVVFAMGLGLLAAHFASQYLGDRALNFLYSDERNSDEDADYDHIEDIWARGEFLEAVQLLRTYLVKNPREIHAARRIAEIYEKDLSNPLAAAMEYEEILKKKLHPERWGWCAIHLCNIYSGKLNRQDQALALLQRIVEEHPNVSAAAKANKRLDMLAGGPIEEQPQPSGSQPNGEPDPSNTETS